MLKKVSCFECFVLFCFCNVAKALQVISNFHLELFWIVVKSVIKLCPK